MHLVHHMRRPELSATQQDPGSVQPGYMSSRKHLGPRRNDDLIVVATIASENGSHYGGTNSAALALTSGRQNCTFTWSFKALHSVSMSSCSSQSTWSIKITWKITQPGVIIQLQTLLTFLLLCPENHMMGLNQTPYFLIPTLSQPVLRCFLNLCWKVAQME